MEILYDEPVVNQDYMNVGHDLTLATWGQEAGARFTESYTRAPGPAINRWMEFGRAEVEESPVMTEEEWKDSPWYREGLQFPNGVKQSVARLVADRKDEERQRQDVMKRSPGGVVRGASMFAVDLAAQFTDPLNIASAFVPVVSTARFTTMAGRYGITGARAFRGAAEGLVGAAMVEPFVYGASKQEQADYGMYDSLMAIGMGTVFGTTLHTGLGKIGDLMGVTPYARQKAISSTAARIVETEAIDAEPVIRAGQHQGSEFSEAGVRRDAAEELFKNKRYDKERVSKTLTTLDTIAKGAWKRGLINNVEDVYRNVDLDTVIKDIDTITNGFDSGKLGIIVNKTMPTIMEMLDRAGDPDGKAFKAMSKEEQTKLVNDFAEYLRTGEKADTPIQQFDKAKKWFLSVYEASKNKPDSVWRKANMDFVALKREQDAILKDINDVSKFGNNIRKKEKLLARLHSVNKKLSQKSELIKSMDKFEDMLATEPTYKQAPEVKVEPQRREFFTADDEAAAEINGNAEAAKQSIPRDETLAQDIADNQDKITNQLHLGRLSISDMEEIAAVNTIDKNQADAISDPIEPILECMLGLR